MKNPRSRYVKLVQFIDEHRHFYTNVGDDRDKEEVPLYISVHDKGETTRRTGDEFGK